jgi:hypothetical protein
LAGEHIGHDAVVVGVGAGGESERDSQDGGPVVVVEVGSVPEGGVVDSFGSLSERLESGARSWRGRGRGGPGFTLGIVHDLRHRYG